MLPHISGGPLYLFKGSLVGRLTHLLNSDKQTLSIRKIQTRVNGGGQQHVSIKEESTARA